MTSAGSNVQRVVAELCPPFHGWWTSQADHQVVLEHVLDDMPTFVTKLPLYTAGRSK